MSDPFLYGIILIPLILALLARFLLDWKLSAMEIVAQLLIGAIIVAGIWGIGRATVGYDTETINGLVTGKHAWEFSCPTNTSNPCRNGYSCNCHEVCSGSGKDKSCHTDCDTCYRYDWERNWYADTNLFTAPQVEIDRADDQGAAQPRRWSEVKPGDPVSDTHTYRNWVRASARSMFKDDGAAEETYKGTLPPYPQAVYDYYKMDRVLLVGSYRPQNLKAWNNELALVAGRLGPSKQVNLVLVIVSTGASDDYAVALRRNWQGFKKNDAVIFVGVDKAGVIRWGESLSWSKASIFDLRMKRMVNEHRGQTLASIGPQAFFAQVSEITARDFERRPMKEFEYLRGDIPPPDWLRWTATIIALLLGAGLSWFFHNFDLDEEVKAFFNRGRSTSRFNRY